MRRLIILGGLIVGALDITEISVFLFLWRDVSPVRILQFVASAVLGESAFSGGTASAALGLVLHFCVATCVAGTYILAAKRYPFLVEQAVLCGLIYGVLVHVVMSNVVVPLTLAKQGAPSWPSIVNSYAGHALLIGLPSALVARRGLR